MLGYGLDSRRLIQLRPRSCLVAASCSEHKLWCPCLPCKRARQPRATVKREEEVVSLFIFARFHSLRGQESFVEGVLRNVVAPSRQEAGCVKIHAYRSIRDPRLFYIHSEWVDEAAFEVHATLPHTVRFLERIESLIDHAL